MPDGDFEQADAGGAHAKVFAEVNQRMLGIQQGIQMLQERVADRVADAQGARPKPQQPAGGRPKPAADARAAPTAERASGPAAPRPPRRAGTTALTGSQLAVRVERDGEVLGQAQRRDQPAEPARHGLHDDASATAARCRSPSRRTAALTRRPRPTATRSRRIESPALDAGTPAGHHASSATGSS